MLTPVTKPVTNRAATWEMDIDVDITVNINAAPAWQRKPGGNSRVRMSRVHDEHELGSRDPDMFDFTELDIYEFDGEEPELAELVLAEEESDVMNLDTSQAPTMMGGMEEDDLLHYEGATGVDHKSAEDSVGMYLHEIGRVSLLTATEEIALAIGMQKGKRAQERLREFAAGLSLDEISRL